MTEITIPGDIDATTATEAHATLLERIGQVAPGAPVTLEVDNPAPTQIALQLLLATAADLRARQAQLNPGEAAGPLLAQAAAFEGE